MVNKAGFYGRINGLKLVRMCVNGQIEFLENFYIYIEKEDIKRLKALLEKGGNKDFIKIIKAHIQNTSEVILELEKYREKLREIRDKVIEELKALGVEEENI